MDIEKEYSCLEQNKKVFQKCVEIDESYQETLQAYCDDLYRIIKCSSHSYVTSVDINNNEVKIFGKTEICLAYYDDKSNLCYADFDEEFQRSVEVQELSDSAFAVARCRDKYCSFRVINQRRIDVHSSCDVSVAVYDKHSCPCVSSCNSSKLKCETIESADVVNSIISKLEFDEEIDVNSSKIKRIINANGNVSLNEIRLIKDKALLKFDVNLALLYSVDSENEMLDRFEHSFSISKIIDVNGIDENTISIINAKIGALYFKIKGSSNDTSSVVEIYGDIMINSVFISKVERKIITDGYILKHKSNCNYSSYPCITNGKQINEDKLQSISFEFNNSIKEVLDLSVSVADTTIKNGKLTASMSATVICKTDNDDLTSYTTAVDVELDSCDFENGIVSIFQKSCDYKLQQNGKIDIRFSYNLSAFLFNESTYNVLSEIEAEDDEISFPALTVYFGKRNENVWNIAKSFSSDIDLIINENELTSDIIDEDKVLIIPSL